MGDITKLRNVFTAQQAKMLGWGITGEVKFGFWSAAPEGWLLLNGSSIGNAGSGATALADLYAYPLFIHLWNTVADAYCPVSGGRGANADADWLAGKTLTLPDARGKMPMCQATAGTGANMAETGGAKDHTHTGPSHTHSVPAHYHGMGTGADLNITASGGHTHPNTPGYPSPNSGSTKPYVALGAGSTWYGDAAIPTNTHTHAAGNFSGSIGLVTGGVSGNASMTSGSGGTGATGTQNQAYLVCNFIIAL